MTDKTPGQLAYEADVAARPTYDDHSPRKAWDQLCEVCQWSWHRNPTPRPWRILTLEEHMS